MNEAAIRVEGLGKRYTIGGSAERYGSLRESLSRAAMAPWRHLGQVQHKSKERAGTANDKALWALRDVSFEVNAGEVIGIIGHNGAGKSTLLKVLSRITEPTTGRVDLYGRVGSLLEVGTGFHPELTGRENIQLSGAILGMSRADIKQHFDAIVSFAEVEQFVNTPVKRYSSGMYVRLAFAVAAHLQPDILVVDEVLALGDMAFQKKCLGKLEQTAQSEGRTVLFVSHDMSAIRRLCPRTIMLSRGQVSLDAPTNVALRRYYETASSSQQIEDTNLRNRLDRTTGSVRIACVTATDGDGRETWTFRGGDTIRLELAYEAFQTVPDLGLLLELQVNGAEVITSFKDIISPLPVPAGTRSALIVELPNVPLRPGGYALAIRLGDKDVIREYDVVDNNVNLPWIMITSDDQDIQRTEGYFSMEAHVVRNTSL